jgi:hypothetical protein
MPEFLKRRLAAQAAQKGYRGARADRYTYGTLNAIRAMHGSQTTAKGRAMAAKHATGTPLEQAIRLLATRRT